MSEQPEAAISPWLADSSSTRALQATSIVSVARGSVLRTSHTHPFAELACALPISAK